MAESPTNPNRARDHSEDKSAVLEVLRIGGYLSNRPGSLPTDEEFARALGAYQAQNGLERTDRLDDRTHLLASEPRCGVPDIGPLSAGAGPWGSRTLRYTFTNYCTDVTEAEARVAFVQACAIWQAATNLDFVEDALNPDISVSFGRGDHGDGQPFDGPGRVLAHAFFPPPSGGALAGDIHVDEDETWSVQVPTPGGRFDLVSLLAHELGHSLGLSHDSDPNSVMYATYAFRRVLGSRDVNAIRQLYPRSFTDATGWAAAHYFSTIQTADLEGDGWRSIVARTELGIVDWNRRAGVWRRRSGGPPWSDHLNWVGPQFYSTIRCGDIDRDGADEILARAGDGIHAWKLRNGAWTQLPNGPHWSDGLNWNQHQYYSTIRLADLDGDGGQELLARAGDGIHAWKFDGAQWTALPRGPQWTDALNWVHEAYYSTIQCADIDNDGHDELLARAGDGVHVWKFTSAGGWTQMATLAACSDPLGWSHPKYYSTLQCADIDGDGRAEVVARAGDGIHAWKYTDGGWVHLATGPAWRDDLNWDQPQYYGTVQCADVDGDGRAEVLARAGDGIHTWKFTRDGTWLLLQASAPALRDDLGWSAFSCYSTIQCADIDHDGSAELLARFSDGLRVFKYGAGGWSETPGPV